IDGTQRTAPDLPGCRGPTELVHEPFLLTGPEDRARRGILSRIRDAYVAKAEFGGRFAAVEGTAGIERDHRRFREHPVESRIVNLANALRIGRVVAAEAVLVGEKEIKVPAVAQRPIRDQAVDGLQIVGFDPEATVVPLFDRYIFHRQRAERIKRSPLGPFTRGRVCFVSYI